MNIKLELPKLNFKKDGKADVSKWLGKGAHYDAGQLDDYYEVFEGDDEGQFRAHFQASGQQDYEGINNALTQEACEAVCQAHFEENLKKPMAWAQACVALNGDCQVKLKVWMQGIYCTPFKHPECAESVSPEIYRNGKPFVPTLAHFNAEWFFHFPEAPPEPEKIIGGVAPCEVWTCPKCHKQTYTDTVIVLNKQECRNCAVIMHRPEKETAK